MPKIPREMSPDSTLALLADPYHFMSRRCRKHGTDLFEARILLQRTICMVGRDAAKLIYDADRFMRKGAFPIRGQKTLVGVGSVQNLDDDEHRDRKRMLMSLMTPARLAALGKGFDGMLDAQAILWTTADRVVLYDAMREVLTRTVCAWAGVPLPEADVAKRTEQLTRMFDWAGRIGPKHWASRRARGQAEQWIGSLVRQVRLGQLDVPADSALGVITRHPDPHGGLLPARIAAVEVINILRPTVAVAVFIADIAHALKTHPLSRERLAGGDERYRGWFVHEVRRFYPFFPFTTARVRETFEWNGYQFPKGRRVMLDLHGTNRDPRVWDKPDTFNPDRFATWDADPFGLIPQGGGDHDAGHRCAGEWITIDLMKRATDFLARRIAYDVPRQDLRLAWTRLPALPNSKMVLAGVRAHAAS
ncbi:MAG TPA: cytochrome P450 [Tepidisphaeraceae bacterium]|jgi:fatty-acid peroxygenase